MNKIFVFLFFSFVAFSQNITQSPKEFLPSYGSQVTFYHEVEDYFTHLTETSSWIQKRAYGMTPQGRELATYIISTPENLKNLEVIRQQHLSKIGLGESKSNNPSKAIVWLSFNVHGNEMGAIESAISVAYELINPANKDTKKWLEDIVVILDPCLNPDGFSRYANWLRDVSGSKTHPEWYDREHMEPWPGGRQNHFVFDLNRDWAWQTQPESQMRMVLYRDWMPMIHVDVHEMGYNEPYFFPPAAEPFHEQITPYQKQFHQQIGTHTAKKFDAENWLYYTAERFDLFYPSYGDTYPSFNGAIGMTYEQGGIGAGRAIKMKNGQVLTLQDRINHHKTAVLAAVELSYLQRTALSESFINYFKNSRTNPKGKYQTYVLKKSAKNKELLALLTRNGIEYQTIAESKKMRGFSFSSHEEEDFSTQENDIVVQIDQPRSVLTQVLFEPFHKLNDSLSYDITSWALPWAHGIETYALKNKIPFKTKANYVEKLLNKDNFKTAYGFYIPWNARSSAEILSALHQNNIKVRMALKPQKMDSFSIERGGLIVTKGDNPLMSNFSDKLHELIHSKEDIQIIKSGLGPNGGDLGGENYQLLEAPKVLLLGGSGVSNIDFGQVWFFMDQVVKYPVSVVELANFNRINLKDFNTLLLPSGYYNFAESQEKKIQDFVRAGGKIIAIDEALNSFENKDNYALTNFATSDAKSEFEKEAEKTALESRTENYEEGERIAISNQISGAIIENYLDVTHPLAFGLGKKYYSLKTSDRCYQWLKDAQNVIYVPEKFKSSGFIGYKIKKQIGGTVSFAVERKGRGNMIYMVDNPLFRGFWEQGNLLFANALFLVQ